jgi:hypothetical protein
MATRVRVTFAGVDYSGFDRGDGRVSVPLPAFRKILDSGKVRCVKTSDHHDDCEDSGLGAVMPAKVREALELGEPTLLYVSADRSVVRFCPHRNLSYDIFELKPGDTKLPVRDNDNPTPQEMEFRKAIHLLQDACDDGLILMRHDDAVETGTGPCVYLVPAILDRDSIADDDDGPKREPGTIEYQVSDGPPGHRSTSHDFYHLAEAVAEFNRIVTEGKW